VPEAAVEMHKPGRFHVMVKGPKGKPVRRNVQVGWRDGGKVEITEGLKPGDQIRPSAGETKKSGPPAGGPNRGANGR